jgi:NAD(P)-dependent dehydrogenase (short-subunit alcohol dehydrogenase family)
MPSTLKGRIALVTGASRGLGKAMALALGQAGARLALVARDQAKLEETAAEAAKAGMDVAVFSADVAQEPHVEALRKQVQERYGQIDILINNAGTNIRKSVEEYSLAEWNTVIGTNMTSVFLMCHHFIPLMKGRGYGRIINLASMMGHVSLPGRAAYSATKAGLIGFTKALAQELAPENISVTAISPGPFATEMNLPLTTNPELNQQFVSRIPLGRWGKVEEVGSLAVYLCSDAAAFITGTDILIDGGWTAQ